jgi:hypothetical protein
MGKNRNFLRLSGRGFLLDFLVSHGKRDEIAPGTVKKFAALSVLISAKEESAMKRISHQNQITITHCLICILVILIITLFLAPSALAGCNKWGKGKDCNPDPDPNPPSQGMAIL